MIMIKNLLHFPEYFHDKIDSMQNLPLDFKEVESIYASFIFCTNAEGFE